MTRSTDTWTSQKSQLFSDFHINRSGVWWIFNKLGYNEVKILRREILKMKTMNRRSVEHKNYSNHEKLLKFLIGHREMNEKEKLLGMFVAKFPVLQVSCWTLVHLLTSFAPHNVSTTRPFNNRFSMFAPEKRRTTDLIGWDKLCIKIVAVEFRYRKTISTNQLWKFNPEHETMRKVHHYNSKNIKNKTYVRTSRETGYGTENK